MTVSDQRPAPDPGPGAMLADVLAGITRLVQGELALARAEAAVAAVAGMGLGPAWASVLVGGIILLVAIGFAGQAMRLMREAGSAPGRSAASIKRDVETLQTMVRRDAPA